MKVPSFRVADTLHDDRDFLEDRNHRYSGALREERRALANILIATKRNSGIEHAERVIILEAILGQDVKPKLKDGLDGSVSVRFQDVWRADPQRSKLLG